MFPAEREGGEEEEAGDGGGPGQRETHLAARRRIQRRVRRSSDATWSGQSGGSEHLKLKCNTVWQCWGSSLNFEQPTVQGSAKGQAPGCVNAAGKARQKW